MVILICCIIYQCCTCRDTAGQEEFNSITEQYFRRAEGILLVYDITNAKSFDNLNKWMEKLRQVYCIFVPEIM